MLIVDMDRYLNKYPRLGAKYLEPLTLRQKRDSWAMSCVQKLMDKMFPHLQIEEDKESNKCEITIMKEQLNSIQNTLEEMKRVFQESQVTSMSAMRNREILQQRRNTIL
jgi:TolA-binding protein